MEKNKQKRYYRRTIDLLFLLMLFIVCAVSFYVAFTFGIIPKQWVKISGVIVIIVYLILFVLSLKRMPTWFVVVKRIFIVLLAVAIGTSGYFLNQAKTTVKNITKTNSGGTTDIYVVVRKEAGITSIEDLAGKTVGYQNGVDQKNAAYGKQELENTVSNIDSVEELDYTTLYQELVADQVQAVVMSDTYFNMTKASFKEFESTVEIIETYSIKNETIKEDIDITKDVFTVYLSGLDNAGSPDQKTRSDTNIIMIVNPLANHIDMVSLPRDGLIPNPALYDMNDKLTHTAMDGIDNSVTSIENFFNIPIDYYARVSFTSLSKIVDALGGVDVDVELDVCAYDESEYRTEEESQTHEGQEVVCVEKGNRTINGAQALIYARHRYTENYDNPGRERAQQRIIKGIMNKLLSANGLSYANTLMEIAPNFVITNMPNDQITNFISSELGELKPWTISSLSSDNGINDYQYVASIDPSVGLLDVYLFNKDEVHTIINTYDGAKKQLQMNTFNFDLNDLYANSPSLNQDTNIIWDTMADSPH